MTEIVTRFIGGQPGDWPQRSFRVARHSAGRGASARRIQFRNASKTCEENEAGPSSTARHAHLAALRRGGHHENLVAMERPAGKKGGGESRDSLHGPRRGGSCSM